MKGDNFCEVPEYTEIVRRSGERSSRQDHVSDITVPYLPRRRMPALVSKLLPSYCLLHVAAYQVLSKPGPKRNTAHQRALSRLFKRARVRQVSARHSWGACQRPRTLPGGRDEALSGGMLSCLHVFFDNIGIKLARRTMILPVPWKLSKMPDRGDLRDRH